MMVCPPGCWAALSSAEIRTGVKVHNMEMSCSAAAAACAGLAGAGTTAGEDWMESGAGMATTNPHIRILLLFYHAEIKVLLMSCRNS